jgi:hypothetical protein
MFLLQHPQQAFSQPMPLQQQQQFMHHHQHQPHNQGKPKQANKIILIFYIYFLLNFGFHNFWKIYGISKNAKYYKYQRTNILWVPKFCIDIFIFIQFLLKKFSFY